ncbi:MAG TPA: isoprenylcysteine carboxylmethyltransferase family protein [Vicinamibacterales bacterium]|nr:isoprenylcysteine carboxylmethyltransferase family protein [Vicinamibacterales bacterium]
MTVRAAYAWGGGAAFVGAILYFLYTFGVTMGEAVPAGTAWATARAVIVDAGLFGLFALHHSLFARRRAKRAVGRVVSAPLERSTFVWVASLLLVLVCAAWQPVGGTLYRHGGVIAWLHHLVVAAGIVLTAISVQRLSAFDLAGIDQARGRRQGRHELEKLVVRWPYTLVRHPIYLAWALFVFGPANMTASRFVFACVSTAYLVIAIPIEERDLVRQFGDAYRRYRQQVRWRMVPGVY